VGRSAALFGEGGDDPVHRHRWFCVPVLVFVSLEQAPGSLDGVLVGDVAGGVFDVDAAPPAVAPAGDHHVVGPFGEVQVGPVQHGGDLPSHLAFVEGALQAGAD
jgi:hypothetical protein